MIHKYVPGFGTTAEEARLESMLTQIRSNAEDSPSPVTELREFSESPTGKVLGFALYVGGGALLGSFIRPALDERATPRDGAIEGALISGVFYFIHNFIHELRKAREVDRND